MSNSAHVSTYGIRAAILVAALFFFVAVFVYPVSSAQQPQQLDPAAWGSNHVGKPVPEFVTGGECLFCHRNTVGVTWQKDKHGITVRQKEDAPQFQELVKSQPKFGSAAKEIEFFLGSYNHIRFMKKNGYGKFAMLPARADIGADAKAVNWQGVDKLDWDKDKFANRCAGCHATGVEAKDRTFAAFGLDCYACHGVVDLEHTNDTSLIWLSKKKKNDALAVTSICASCHLREGKSKSTGLPYPNNFVAGDNLFQDFQVDWSKADDKTLNPGDRHVYRNVRDVVLNGKQTTCLNCHVVHGNASSKHRLVARTEICSDCHDTEKKIYKPAFRYTVTSPLCEY